MANFQERSKVLYAKKHLGTALGHKNLSLPLNQRLFFRGVGSPSLASTAPAPQYVGVGAVWTTGSKRLVFEYQADSPHWGDVLRAGDKLVFRGGTTFTGNMKITDIGYVHTSMSNANGTPISGSPRKKYLFITAEPVATTTVYGIVGVYGSALYEGNLIGTCFHVDYKERGYRPEPMTGENAIAALELSYTDDITSNQYLYTGEANERDEKIVISDNFATLEFESFLPSVVKNPSGAATDSDNIFKASDVPLVELFEACGMDSMVPLNTVTRNNLNDTIVFKNGQVDEPLISLEFVRTSSTGSKRYVVTECRGSVGISGTIGEYAKLKFKLQGNPSVPTTLTQGALKRTLSPNWGKQKVNLAGRMQANTVSGTLYPLNFNMVAVGSDPITFGAYVNDTARTGANKATNALLDPSSLCFQTFSDDNLSGFAYERLLLSCEEGWSRTLEPSDLTLTVLESEATKEFAGVLKPVGASGVSGGVGQAELPTEPPVTKNPLKGFNPEGQLGKTFALSLAWGKTTTLIPPVMNANPHLAQSTARQVIVRWSNLKLTNLSRSTINNLAAVDLTFRVNGTCQILLR